MSIVYLENHRIFLLQTNKSTYAVHIDSQDRLLHLYWGPKLTDVRDLPTVENLRNCRKVEQAAPAVFLEYAGKDCRTDNWEGSSVVRSVLDITFADGTRNVELRYHSYTIDNETLTITLVDELFCLFVDLEYQLWPDMDLVGRRTRIRNCGEMPLTIDSVFSALWRLPRRGKYRLTHMSGSWGSEYRLMRQDVLNGEYLLESRSGLSGPQAVPFFMLDENGTATEQQGSVYFGTLQWSGNHKIIVEKDEFDFVHVRGGVSDYDFAWPLAAGEAFETPVFLAGWTNCGFGQASIALHDFQRKVLMRKEERERIMPVLFNPFGVFQEAIDEEKVLSLVDQVAALGIECYILDAGWFGYGVGLDYAKGIGDWKVNTIRFPNGLHKVADAIHDKGMLFGLWMEPETVHPDSELYRLHPDWILRYPAREPKIEHSRYILNFALDDVREYMLDVVCKLIDEYQLDYFKMDLCRSISESGSPLFPPEQQKTLNVRYVRNLYAFYNEIARRYPKLMIENCAGGGRRVDLGMIQFSGRINRSDNQDPLDILRIHEGFSHIMIPKLAGGGCHISRYANVTKRINGRSATLRFMAHVGMMGSLAVGENLLKCTQDELQEIAGYIARYKEIRRTICMGDCHRLASATDKPYAAFEYVMRDGAEAVLFVLGQFMHYSHTIVEPIRLYGLIEDAEYDVEEYGVHTGRGLMNAGLYIPLIGDMDSHVIHIRRK